MKYERRFTGIVAEGVIQMMSLARLRPLAAVTATLILVIAGVAVQGHQQPGPAGAREPAKAKPPSPTGAVAVPDLAANRALARKQLTVIDEAWAFLVEMAVNGRVDLSDGTIGLWGRRRLEALRQAGAEKAEIVAALESYINDLEKVQAFAKAKFAAAQATQLGVSEIRFLRLEAEIWLNEEKAR